jgi:hypothetical protein
MILLPMAQLCKHALQSSNDVKGIQASIATLDYALL